PADRGPARSALRPDRGRAVADDPDLFQSEAFQRPGSHLAPGRLLLRLHAPLLPIRLGLAAGRGDPDDAGRSRPLCLADELPELLAPTAGGPPPLGPGRGLCPAARGPLPARPL